MHDPIKVSGERIVDWRPATRSVLRVVNKTFVVDTEPDFVPSDSSAVAITTSDASGDCSTIALPFWRHVN